MSSSGETAGRGLGALAIIIAIVALVVSLGIVGPEGRQGPEGAQGPSGPGTLMAQDSADGGASIGSTCTHYTGAEVAITVPGPGNIVVSAKVQVSITHASSTRTLLHVVISDAATDCTADGNQSILDLPANLPGDKYTHTVIVLKSFAVAAAGTYTYHVNGKMLIGVDPADSFQYASMVAVFYPQ